MDKDEVTKQVKHQVRYEALTLCSSNQVKYLNFDLHKSCYFSHNGLFMHIHSFFFKVHLYILSRTSFSFHGILLIAVSNSSSSLLYNLANATYTYKTVIATEILPLENYQLVLWLFFFAIGNILSYIFCYFAFITFSEVF